VVLALAQHFAQRAVSGEGNRVEQVGQPKFAGFLVPGVQNGLGRGCDQKELGLGPGQLTVGEEVRHVAQADEGLAYAHGHGSPGQPMAFDRSQDLVLQSLFFRLGRRGRTNRRSVHGQEGLNGYEAKITARQ